jgi:F0F1-type ATP synthase assembly protein I
MAEKRDDDKEIRDRFPASPAGPEIPEAPRIDVKLPPRADSPQPGRARPGAYRKLAIGATAASSFVAPIIVLAVGGMWLDHRLHTSIWAFVGALVGFVAGIVSLLRIIQQLNE